MKKKMVFLIALFLILLCGCSKHQVIEKNGEDAQQFLSWKLQSFDVEQVNGEWFYIQKMKLDVKENYKDSVKIKKVINLEFSKQNFHIISDENISFDKKSNIAIFKAKFTIQKVIGQGNVWAFFTGSTKEFGDWYDYQQFSLNDNGNIQKKDFIKAINKGYEKNISNFLNTNINTSTLIIVFDYKI